MKLTLIGFTLLLANFIMAPYTKAGPHGTILVREVDLGAVTIDGDFSDWPLENFENIVELPPTPAGLEAESVDSRGDHLVFELERTGLFNDTDPAELTKAGPSDFGVSTYFAYDSESFYILSVFIDEMIRGDRDTTETGDSGFLNDGFEFFIDAKGDSEDCAADLMFPAFDDEDPNRDDMQITIAINENFLPENAAPDQLGVRQGIERGGNPDLSGPVKNGPGGLLRDALDALDGPDIAARRLDDLRAAGAINPEIAANPDVTFTGYVIEQRIPFGFIPEFNSDNIMKYSQFWRDFDDEGDAGGANQSWITWSQNSTVGCADDVAPAGLFHAGTWAALEFVTDNPLNNRPGPNISLRKQIDFGIIEIPPTKQDLTIPVRNTGITNALTIESVTVSGEGFEVVSFPASLDPKAGGDILLAFDSQGVTGPYEAVLEIKSDDEDADDQTRQVNLLLATVDPAGPDAHLRLDETDGSVLADSSGNGRGGEINTTAGSASVNQEPVAADRSVQVAGGAAVRIDGADFDVLDSFTTSLWIQPDSAGGQESLVSKGGGGSPIFAILRTGANAAFFVNDGPIFSTEGDLISVGGKHHIVAVYDNTEGARKASIYIDGVEAGSLDEPTALDDFESEPWWLGSFAGALGFSGLIDDFQFYARALTAEEIGTLTANPGDPFRSPGLDGGGGGAAEGGLEGYWAFDEGEGNTAADGGAVGRTAEFRSGAPTWTDGKSGSALAFDGDDDVTVPGWKGVGGADQRTVSYWLRTDWAVDAASGTVGWGANATGLKWHLRLNENAGNGPVGAVRTEIQGSFHIGTKVINDNAWHHVVSIFPEGGQFMQDLIHYVDGELQEVGGTGSTTVEVNTAGEAESGTDVTFGSRLQDVDQFFIGALDDISIWSKALSAEEVLALFKGATPPDVAAGHLETGGRPSLSSVSGTGFSLPDGVTADIEYSQDLVNWEIIAPGASGTFEDTDPDRIARPAGYYRGVVQ